MGVDLSSKLTSLTNLISKNNTTGSADDISNGLTTRVKVFYKGVKGMAENKPIPKNLYPAIVVELVNKEEILPDMGNNTKRDMEIYYNIVSIVDLAGVPGIGRETSDTEIIKLTQNVEALIRGKITLSNTCDWCGIESTEFSEVYKDDIHNSVSKIILKTYLYKQR